MYRNVKWECTPACPLISLWLPGGLLSFLKRSWLDCPDIYNCVTCSNRASTALPLWWINGRIYGIILEPVLVVPLGTLTLFYLRHWLASKPSHHFIFDCLVWLFSTGIHAVPYGLGKAHLCSWKNALNVYTWISTHLPHIKGAFTLWNYRMHSLLSAVFWNWLPAGPFSWNVFYIYIYEELSQT